MSKQTQFNDSGGHVENYKSVANQMGMPLPGHTQTHEQMDKQSRIVIHPAPSIGWVETISEMC